MLEYTHDNLVGKNVANKIHFGTTNVNIGEPERMLSLVGGIAIAFVAIARRKEASIPAFLASAYLLFRGVSGHDYIYEHFRVNTAVTGHSRTVSVPHQQGIKMEHTVTVSRSPEALYQYWRQLENLPQFMNHLELVEVQSDRRSHWVAKAPAGMTVEWDAEIINDVPNEVIGWHSVDGSTIDNAGSVRFAPSMDGDGTEVRVSLNYVPPAGAVGAAIAKIFGEEPSQQIAEDLQRFKQAMETGDVSASNGQNSDSE